MSLPKVNLEAMHQRARALRPQDIERAVADAWDRAHKRPAEAPELLFFLAYCAVRLADERLLPWPAPPRPRRLRRRLHKR